MVRRKGDEPEQEDKALERLRQFEESRKPVPEINPGDKKKKKNKKKDSAKNDEDDQPDTDDSGMNDEDDRPDTATDDLMP